MSAPSNKYSPHYDMSVRLNIAGITYNLVGRSTTEITDGGTETAVVDGQSVTPTNGTAVVYDNDLFRWDGTKWVKIGDFARCIRRAYASTEYFPSSQSTTAQRNAYFKALFWLDGLYHETDGAGGGGNPVVIGMVKSGTDNAAHHNLNTRRAKRGRTIVEGNGNASTYMVLNDSGLNTLPHVELVDVVYNYKNLLACRLNLTGAYFAQTTRVMVEVYKDDGTTDTGINGIASLTSDESKEGRYGGHAYNKLLVIENPSWAPIANPVGMWFKFFISGYNSESVNGNDPWNYPYKNPTPLRFKLESEVTIIEVYKYAQTDPQYESQIISANPTSGTKYYALITNNMYIVSTLANPIYNLWWILNSYDVLGNGGLEPINSAPAGHLVPTDDTPVIKGNATQGEPITGALSAGYYYGFPKDITYPTSDLCIVRLDSNGKTIAWGTTTYYSTSYGVVIYYTGTRVRNQGATGWIYTIRIFARVTGTVASGEVLTVPVTKVPVPLTDVYYATMMYTFTGGSYNGTAVELKQQGHQEGGFSYEQIGNPSDQHGGKVDALDVSTSTSGGLTSIDVSGAEWTDDEIQEPIGN